MRASPYLTRFPASLDPSPYPLTRRYREAPPAAASPLPRWWDDADAPLVYVSFGSVVGGLPIAVAAYRSALDGVASLQARVLLTVGRETDVAALAPVPPNVHVEPWVPQSDVLGEAAMVVAHGGSGTTFGALASGVPLVLVPFFADQLPNAGRVAATGAAVLVEAERGSEDRMSRLRPEHAPRLRAAIEAVLSDPAYARAARRVAAEMRAGPSADELIAAGMQAPAQ